MHDRQAQAPLVNEELLTLSQAARLPALRNAGRGGRPPSPGRMARWSIDGIRLSDGRRAVLQSVRMPSGQRMVTAGWIAAFIESLNAAGPSPIAAAAAARLSHVRAECELDAAGI